MTKDKFDQILNEQNTVYAEAMYKVGCVITVDTYYTYRSTMMNIIDELDKAIEVYNMENKVK